MLVSPLPSSFHLSNRQKLSSAIGPDAVAIIDTADIWRRAGDFEYPFRPDSNFYYLTGIDEPEAVLVLAPGHPNQRLREVLFLSETSDQMALWAGRRLSKAQGTQLSGITTVMWLSELDNYLSRLLRDFQTIYLNNEPSPGIGPSTPATRRAISLRSSMPTHRLKSAYSIIGSFRNIKAAVEIEQIRRAIDLTHKGLLRAWSNLQPDVAEYVLEAELSAQFARLGASGNAFRAIIGAGKNATVIHYQTGAANVAETDIVLFDVGAESDYYAADISRTVPASGRFSQRQRAIYEAVYRVQQAGIAMHKPGTTIAKIDAAMRKLFIPEIEKLGLLDEKQAASSSADHLLMEYYPHISHHLGLDVHDTGNFNLDLVPGMVVTCEPGLYIQKEGIGVRLEDIVLITDTGYELLSRAIPSDPDEIETLISSKSL